MLHLQCELCGMLHHADEEHVGKYVRCAQCGHPILIQSRSSVEVNKRSSTTLTPDMTPMPRKALVVYRERVLISMALLVVVFAAILWNVSSSQNKDITVPLGQLDPQVEIPNRPLSKAHESDISPGRQEKLLGDATHGVAVAADDLEPARPFPRAALSSSKRKVLDSDNRLLNGQKVKGANENASLGELKIENGNPEDAYVELVDIASDEVVRGIYVRARSNILMSHIDEGRYKLLFTQGFDWDTGTETFNRFPSYLEFQRELFYFEKEFSDHTQFKSISITLHSVLNGNVQARKIDKSQFVKRKKANFRTN